ncbi:hypothetical protein LRP67_10155 [Nocardioides sp. cx-169]|uniref:hypothetical protein n=1 Tax=Nocardioides sp. cx-169 TaxID=2899080 RepID=UPI001E5BF411|nr:hypothetical protein [Nocardioides sp. cx-169]MCD4534445.1 hypothetical protein [Nocardioides sp. cx-169]
MTLSRARALAAVLTVAAIVVLGAVLLTPGGPDRDGGDPGGRDLAPVTHAPEPAPSPKPDPAAIVDDPRASIAELTVRASDPDVRSVVWRLCRTPRCRRSDEALAVTDDGFVTRHLLPLPTHLYATPMDGVLLLGNGPAARIVQPDGSVTAVRWDAGEPAPLRDGEHLVTSHRFPCTASWWTVTPSPSTPSRAPRTRHSGRRSTREPPGAR